MFRTKSKWLIALLLVLVLSVSMLCFVACNNDDDTQEGVKNIKVLIGNKSLSVSTDEEYLHDALVELKEEGKIVYEFEMGQYGATVMKLDSFETTSDWSKWIAVYHDINDITLYDPQYDIQQGGKTYHSSSLGVSSLPVQDGATYLFVQN